MKHYQEPYKYYVYIMASKKNGTLYVGVTNDIARRAFEHRTNMNKKSFTARYNVHNLVYMETCDSPNVAIEREKQIKSWSRQRKIDLIESMNPDWTDMFDYLNC
ncbi:MAG: GIY-YIG nuclease family protein [Alphaproteobacteria bacterium]|nr:GIY-YIG nuclease family protein [Alphaproteobacteria bacterium]